MVAPENLSPELTYIAMAGDEIAAFSMNGVSEEENQRNGVKEGVGFMVGHPPGMAPAGPGRVVIERVHGCV